MAGKSSKYASRSGDKLCAALEAFHISPQGLVCADFGCNVGGFTDCLLQHGAAKVYAVDTGYGALAWPLRKDPRVVVMERTNAIHCDRPEAVDLVTIDVAWTPQQRIVPAALKWLKSTQDTEGNPGRIVSLLKPHYEQAKRGRSHKREPLTDEKSESLCLEVCTRLGALGCTVQAVMKSPLLGKGGNQEFLLSLIHNACRTGQSPIES